MFIYFIPLIISVVIATFYHFNILKLDNKFYGLALLSISLFSGLRANVGFDWASYTHFFDVLDLNNFGTQPENFNFEAGYYLLNYLVKLLGGSYQIILIFSSLFLFYTLHQLTKHISTNNFYILTSYISFSFIYINFAGVRQGLAFSFFILGCSYYIRYLRGGKSIAIAALGIFFHISSIIYIFLITATIFSIKKKLKNLMLYVIFFSIASYLTLFIDSNIINKIDFLNPFFVKFLIYKDRDSAASAYQNLFFIYLIFLSFFILLNMNSNSLRKIFIFRFAIISIICSVILGILFSNSYVFFQRAYLAASLFQSYSLALIFSSRRSKLNTFIFILTVSVSIIYFFRILDINSKFFIPYQIISINLNI